ncbi:uncharacterized protein LOC142230905 [Haematobia irritans]|uniref:uncharacterized protein LOC142230905 n=1 Tax=Haematobia irritans TaxID=7368 RepID=UPI003F50990D
MKDFFEHIKYKHGLETTATLKKYCNTIERLAKQTQRSKFLQQCRRFGILPSHISNSTKNIKALFKLQKTKTEAEKAEYNFQCKILNIEIKETHTNIRTTKKDLEKIEKEMGNTLNETELTEFKKNQWNRYRHIKQKTKSTHTSKLERLRSNQFNKLGFKYNNDWFINNTDVKFTRENKWILSMGKKFALPVNKYNFAPIPLIADIEQWIQTKKDETEKEILRSKIAGRISNYKRRLNNNEREKFIRAIYEETRKYIRQYKDEIMITTADKGNKTVIMYKDEYTRKMTLLLEDKSTYRRIRENPTEKLQKKNNNLIKDLHKNNWITKWEKIKLTTNAAEAPELYGLPKIHKEGTPLRPISSSLKVPCYNLAQHIGQIIKNATSPIYNIKNSGQLKGKLENIKLDKDDILVSFDVVSLFTNIPTHLAIRNILDKWETLQNHTTIPKRKFLELLQFCLIDNNYFTFKETIYHQTYGMPMGNPLSPTIADIVLDKLLDDVTNELKHSNIEFKILVKYVDDIFAIIKKPHLETILKLLNSYHNKIKFTVEIEEDNRLPYLDMTIIRDNNKIITDWYTKKTASGRMISYFSTQPKSMKINTAKNLIKKVVYLSDKSFMENNIQKVTNILLKNNFPIATIKSIIKNCTEKENPRCLQEPKKTFYSVPYIPQLTDSNILKSIINDNTTTIAYKSNETLRAIFSREKKKTKKLKQNNVVYEVTCIGKEGEKCNKVYVGTTRRMLAVRMSEHEADINKGKQSTALAQHVKEYGHIADLKNVKILDKEKIENKRYTLESLRIQERIKTCINTKEDKDNTKLHYSVAIV